MRPRVWAEGPARGVENNMVGFGVEVVGGGVVVEVVVGEMGWEGRGVARRRA